MWKLIMLIPIIALFGFYIFWEIAYVVIGFAIMPLKSFGDGSGMFGTLVIMFWVIPGIAFIIWFLEMLNKLYRYGRKYKHKDDDDK